MQALHSTLLPPSAVHYSLFLPNFTPSTIYALPRPHTDAPETKIIGNLIVAGNEDVRVFEIRESSVARTDSESVTNGVNGEMNGDAPPEVDGMEEDFYDNGPLEVRYFMLWAIAMHLVQLLIPARTGSVREDTQTPPIDTASAARDDYGSGGFEDD